MFPNPTVFSRCKRSQCALASLLLCCSGWLLPEAQAASCTTQSQMTEIQRVTLSNAARDVLMQMQTGNMLELRANTIPAVAADFGGIAASVNDLKPLVQGAKLTVDEIYILDASGLTSTGQVEFFCGSPVVALNFTALPPGVYGLAILHATGVQQPQQVSLMLSKATESKWMLAGFFRKPMIEAGHDGLWYWVSARKYAQTKMDWNAWLYYQLAINLLDPVDFLSSSNLGKLRQEADQAHPAGFPGPKPLTLNANGAVFTVTGIDTSTAFGGLDLDVHYSPDAAEAAQLHDPPAARKQVTDVMTALLTQHPELHDAFHGIWVHADQGGSSLFALELPMTGIAGGNPAIR
jgi:hypothetical protein